MEKNLLFDIILNFQVVGTILYVFFLAWIVLGLRRLNIKSTSVEQPFVSVIIAARNEEKNIASCLDHLLLQNYPKEKIDIIVVDDHSEDATAAICRGFESVGVQLFSLPDVVGVSPKKAALHLGIQKSRGEIILVTDADCRASTTWISTIIKYFEKNTAAVASWLYVEEDDSLLGKIESLDSLSLSFVGAAGFGWGKPFIANGANFAYRRQVYDELNGFDGVAQFVSGDDDLLLQKIHTAKKWTCAFAPEWQGVVSTDANPTLGRFLAQRFRWASKSSIHPVWLVGFEVFVYFYLLSFVLSVFLFLRSGFSVIYLLPFFAKVICDFFFMKYATPHVKKKMNPIYLFLTEWLQIFYVIIVGIGGLRGNYTWKGRHYTRGRVS
jgi:cellulose synthase/poly-beta-1,6-N-acetylglucosamine synthase-like glycosyltransferase